MCIYWKKYALSRFLSPFYPTFLKPRKRLSQYTIKIWSNIYSPLKPIKISFPCRTTTKLSYQWFITFCANAGQHAIFKVFMECIFRYFYVTEAISIRRGPLENKPGILLPPSNPNYNQAIIPKWGTRGPSIFKCTIRFNFRLRFCRFIFVVFISATQKQDG